VGRSDEVRIKRGALISFTKKQCKLLANLPSDFNLASSNTDASHRAYPEMCPMRFILLALSCMIAGFVLYSSTSQTSPSDLTSHENDKDKESSSSKVSAYFSSCDPPNAFSNALPHSSD